MKRTKSRKKLQKGTPDLNDRISDLPDSILSLILSSLPTKNAVATSILSKRWKFLWMTVLNLDFCHRFNRRGQGEDEDMKFVRFVNRVLLHHDAGLLHKFRLVWKCRCIPSQVNSWISTAISRNVSQLYLNLNRYERMGGRFEIPTSVFSCDTLQSLVLKGIISVPASIVVCLPRLESLKLVSVCFKSEEALQKIIRGCPMLNYLHLHNFFGIHPYYFREVDWSEFRYIISSTSLRRLELGVDYWDYPFPCRLELEASSLEYLKLEGFISQILVQGSLSSLVEADFRIQWLDDSEFTEADDYNSVVEAVQAFDCAKSLTFSTHVMWALSHATICLSTKFSRLKELKAGADCFCCSSFEDFIQSSDNLEVLTIYQESIDQDVSDSDLDESDLDYSNCNHSNWTAPVEVPRCLSNSLKAVVFDGYSGSDNEREMIGYMLKHGSVLETMQISCYSNMHGVKYVLVQEICKFPRKSTACKVEFSTSRFYEPRAGEMNMYYTD